MKDIQSGKNSRREACWFLACKQIYPKEGFLKQEKILALQIPLKVRENFPEAVQDALPDAYCLCLHTQI